MAGASGHGAPLGMGEWGDDDLITDVERPTPSAALVVNDWFWGGQPPVPTIIPWTWLQAPIEMRIDQPINSAEITPTGGNSSSASNFPSQATYGVFSASASLDTISIDDAQNFATWLVTYYANPLLRVPVLTLSLIHRTDEERWRILGREAGDRITLGPGTIQDAPGHLVTLPVPAGLPPGAVSFVIEGFHHTSSPTERTVEWTTAPLIGTTPGIPGPWFRWDYSRLDGTDVIPF